MIIILPFIAVCLCQIIDINLGTNNSWSQKQSGSYNYTYKISQANYSFISVQVILSEENKNFILVSKFRSPVIDFNGQFIQGSTIDMISVYENRLTRYLKIPTIQFPIYISTFDETTKSAYQIYISSVNSLACDNNCSQNGVCLEDGCDCNYGYVGNDCHQEANEILNEDENWVFLKQPIQYFYLDLKYFEGNSMKLIFSTDGDYSISIYLEKTQALALPDQNSQSFDERMVEHFTVTNSDPVYLQFDIPEFFDGYSRLVFAAVVEGADTNTFYDLLVVNINTGSEEESSSKATIIVAVVVTVGGAIVIAAVAFFIFRHLKNKKEAENRINQYAAPPIIIQPINIIPIPKMEEQINYVNQNLIQINQKEINPDETCSVCLENLVNGKELTQTICKHTFHKHCIIQWAQKHLECPICRTGLATVVVQPVQA